MQVFHLQRREAAMDNEQQEEQPQMSPIIKDPIESAKMTFPQAIQEVINGKRITKLEWNDRKIFGFLGEDGRLKINLPTKLDDWVLIDGDLVGIDWIVLEEAN